MKLWKQVASATFAWGFVASAALAQALPGPVVDTAWLAANIDKVQVVDVRGNVKSFATAPEFDTDAKTGKKTLTEVGGHLAGSVLIDMKTMRVERKIGDQSVKYMIPEKAAFEKVVQTAGVNGDKPIVLVPVGVDVTDVDDALRVYWQFKVYGEKNIAVLDGGMAAWLGEGRPVVTDAAAGKAGTWVAKADESARYFAGSDDVANAIAKKDATLIDSRDNRQYLGLGKRDYVFAYGHLEGAKLFSPDLMTKTVNGAVKFMSPATYRGVLQAQGIDPNAGSISYCNSGHLSSGPWFVMSELLGNKNAKLYDGSLHEWTLEKRALVGAVPLN